MEFLRLIRWVNLLIIAATMYSIRLFLLTYEKLFPNELKEPLLGRDGESFDFFLLVLSTIMIAAAGNVINDYFDMRADRINKPNRVIVGKTIKRRWAIIIHSALNVGAFAIAIYLGVRNHTFWYLFIHLITMNSLWFYSLFLKKQPLIGNFLIAGLTAMVPILCGIHFYVQQSLIWTQVESQTAFSYWFQALIEDGHFIILLAFFAFVNNFAREIIKDMEDIDGDKKVGAKTLPIVSGMRSAKIWSTGLLILPVLFFSALFFMHQSRVSFSIFDQLIIFFPVVISFVFDILAILMLWKSKTKDSIVKVDRLVKMAMISGILTSVYWYFAWI
jgi:4-hydroxybenzoate polyprenyltransferase|tara:strand:- start:41615 stop:42607 length:993 start_codon:yes stop_codon:yes gene_type:complete